MTKNAHLSKAVAALTTGFSSLFLMAYDLDTMAFYPFKDGAPGASAVGTPIRNGVDSSKHVGTVTVKNATKPAPRGTEAHSGGVTFDGDVPAKYIFEGKGSGAKLICVDPQALHFTGDPEPRPDEGQRAGGNVSFADIGTELSACDEYTVEFFWKLDAEAFCTSAWSSFLTYNCGYLHEGETVPTSLTLPEAAWYGRVWYGDINANQLAVAYQYSPTDWPADGSKTVIGDGKWHHVAIQQGRTADGGLCYSAWLDYDVPDHRTRNGQKAMVDRERVETSEPLDVGRWVFRGRIACLRVVRRRLPKSEFLYASNDSRFCPDLGETVFHWRLDGVSGEDATTLANAVPTYRAVNPGLFYATETSIVSDGCDGTGRAFSDQGGCVRYSNGLPFPRKIMVYDAPDRPVEHLLGENGGTAIVSPAAVYGTSDWLVPSAGLTTGQSVGNGVVAPNFNAVTNGSFTCECFVRIDRTAFLAKNRVTAYPRAAIMGSAFPGWSADWKLYFDYETLSGQMRMRPKLAAYFWNPETAKPEMREMSQGEVPRGAFLDDERWHHVAVVYDDQARTMTAHVDYQETGMKIELPCPYVPLAKPSEQALRFGYGLGDQNMEGAFDEVRYSRVALTSDRFLRMERRLCGIVFVVR